MEGGKKHHYSNLVFSHGLRFSGFLQSEKIFTRFLQSENIFTAAASILTPTFACLSKTFCQLLRLQAEVSMADNPEASRRLAPSRGSQGVRCLGSSPERLTSL